MNTPNETNVTSNKKPPSLDFAWAYTAVGTGGMLFNLLIFIILLSDRKFLKTSALIFGIATSHFLCALAIGTSGIYRVINLSILNEPTSAWSCVLKIYPAAQPFAFQSMGVMLFLTGIERFTVFVFPHWYRIKWTTKNCWLLVGTGYLFVLSSLCPGFYFAWYQPMTTLFCGYNSVFGKMYICYSNVVSVVGGTIAVGLTVAGLIVGRKQVKKLPLLSGEAGKFKRQLKMTRSMLSVALCDFSLVVVPNTLFIISVVDPKLFPKLAEGNFSNYTNVTYCVNTMTTLVSYLAFSSRFRACARKLLSFGKVSSNKVTVMTMNHTTALEMRTRASGVREQH